MTARAAVNASIALTILLVAGSVWAGIATTKHNLSVTGPGPIKSTEEQQICIFCHTPHAANTQTTYLWNRRLTADSAYTPYTSSTMHTTVDRPNGASKLCLSCHDGTIALGEVLARRDGETNIPMAGGMTTLPSNLRTNLGTNLTNDHPVSFFYDDSLASANGELAPPNSLTGPVRLDTTGRMQCTACHDPHEDGPGGKFLVADNRGGALCTTCHTKTDWDGSSHASSNATWNGSGTDPWPNSPYTTVADNACQNCHTPHLAGGAARLLNYAAEEVNCFVCHNGGVANTNILAAIDNKPYKHPVRAYTGRHDPTENYTTQAINEHVECQDCHNPHRASGAGASAPNVPGSMRGVTGVTSSGSWTLNSSSMYEICYKCHSGSNNVVSSAEIRRVDVLLDTRLEFDPSNSSYHPVEAAGRNANVPSLYNGYTESSIIYCTSCHNNDSASSQGNGPHGSQYEHILERNYATQESDAGSSNAADLCYKCHSSSSILNNASGFPHRDHLSSGMGGGGGGMGGMGGAAACATCHDPHASRNVNHLINFNRDVVSPLSGETNPRFVDNGTFAGSCYLVCHGRTHNPCSYGSGMGGGMCGGGGGGGMGGG